jgi:hypothetical protein
MTVWKGCYQGQVGILGNHQVRRITQKKLNDGTECIHFQFTDDVPHVLLCNTPGPGVSIDGDLDSFELYELVEAHLSVETLANGAFKISVTITNEKPRTITFSWVRREYKEGDVQVLEMWAM